MPVAPTNRSIFNAKHVFQENMSVSSDTYTVLVTGANSGLGLAVCRRLIDEFLHTRPQSQKLHLIPTSRSTRKCSDTKATLQAHLEDAAHKANRSLPGVADLLKRRVCIRPDTILDLTSLPSVRALARELQDDREIGSIDALILNAGIGGWVGVNWGTAIWTILTDSIQALTWPTYKQAATGWVTKLQLPQSAVAEKRLGEPQLGEIFCANVFGHYMLGHYLAPLLARNDLGRVIWISSLEAYAHSFQFDSTHRDLQGIRNRLSYESSKRLTDILALTSRMPSSANWTSKYYQNSQDKIDESTQHTRMYVCQPGICATGIMPLPWILAQLMLVAFFLARLIGSMWHTCTAYKGACSAVWLALASQETLDRLEKREGVSKWGSAVTAGGEERVERTEVEGWGYGGVVGDSKNSKSSNGFKRGRRRGVKELTEADRNAFEELGRECWSEMEDLRSEWEERLDAAGI